MFKKYKVGFVSAGGVAGTMVGGLFVAGVAGSLPLGAAAPAVAAGAADPAAPEPVGLLAAAGVIAGIDAGVEVVGLVVIGSAAVPPAAPGELAAVGGGDAAPAASAESLGELESLLQLMAARRAVPISHAGLRMLTS